MPKPLDDSTIDTIAEYLRHRPGIPHMVAAWHFKQQGISISGSYIRTIRRSRRIKYERDSRIHNAIHFAKSHDIEVTHEYLLKKCPVICTDHRNYLIEHYANTVRKELPPFKVGGIAGVVTQILLAA